MCQGRRHIAHSSFCSLFSEQRAINPGWNTSESSTDYKILNWARCCDWMSVWVWFVVFSVASRSFHEVFSCYSTNPAPDISVSGPREYHAISYLWAITFIVLSAWQTPTYPSRHFSHVTSSLTSYHDLKAIMLSSMHPQTHFYHYYNLIELGWFVSRALSPLGTGRFGNLWRCNA